MFTGAHSAEGRVMLCEGVCVCVCDCNRTVKVCSRSNKASSFRAVSHILTRSHFTLHVLLAGLYHPTQVGLAVLMVLTVDQLALWDVAGLRGTALEESKCSQ